MGIPREPKPAKLFMSLIASEDEILQLGVQDLALTYGEVDFISERLPFNFTRYYAQEMGEQLFRRFITFGHLISVVLLPDIKRTTNRLEGKYAFPNGNRRLNIDPGYLCLQHVILATTKGYAHRTYLREGIYADLTLIYQNKSFRPLEWTYPDYRQERVIGLFNRFRKKYAEELKKEIRYPW
jgi:hypothetical protein